MNKRTAIIGAIIIIVIIFAGYMWYNNSYALLKPVGATHISELMLVEYSDEMVKNFPAVLRHYHVPFKMNDSGHFLIPVKYIKDIDLIWTMTDCTLDSSRMELIRREQ